MKRGVTLLSAMVYIDGDIHENVNINGKSKKKTIVVALENGGSVKSSGLAGGGCSLPVLLPVVGRQPWGKHTNTSTHNIQTQWWLIEKHIL